MDLKILWRNPLSLIKTKRTLQRIRKDQFGGQCIRSVETTVDEAKEQEYVSANKLGKRTSKSYRIL
jgi:hypothetical protein